MDSVIRALAVYVILLAVTRFSGRRTLAQITVFDFVLLLIISETIDQAIMGDDLSVTNAAVVIITLSAIDVGLAYAKGWSPRLGTALDGTPTVLVAKGVVDAHALRRARVGLSDILQAGRELHGLRSLEQIDFAVLEVGGAISIIPKEGQGG